MPSALLIANPAASQFTGGLHRSALRSLSRRHDVEAAWPTTSRESMEVAESAVESGTELVVAMGGDGVVHHVAQGLVNTSAILGIIPVGTTNVLARILGAPSNPRKAVRLLARGFTPRRIPTLALDCRSYQAEFTRHALFSLGVGPDAAVVEQAEQDPLRKRSFGSIHYLGAALNTIRSDLRRREPTVAVTAGDRRGAGIGLMVQFHDVYTYFGRSPLVLGNPDPMAVLVIEQIRLRRVLSMLNGARRSRDLGAVAGLELWEGVEGPISVRSRTPVEVQADGELLAAVTELDVRFQPRSLTVATAREH